MDQIDQASEQALNLSDWRLGLFACFCVYRISPLIEMLGEQETKQVVIDTLTRLETGDGRLDDHEATRLLNRLRNVEEYEADDPSDSSFWVNYALAAVEHAIVATQPATTQEGAESLITVIFDLLPEVNLSVDPDVEELDAVDMPLVRGELQAQEQTIRLLTSHDLPSAALVERLRTLSEPYAAELRAKLPRWVLIEGWR
ncbi:hypothetical protein [Nonomuraea sp. 10N515B]|uniref:hypothetical protein n=1 Tax=Nonomuraea sp. 10N515B TaxID=3457422 RepID=UPI003FCDD1F4